MGGSKGHRAVMTMASTVTKARRGSDTWHCCGTSVTRADLYDFVDLSASPIGHSRGREKKLEWASSGLGSSISPLASATTASITLPTCSRPPYWPYSWKRERSSKGHRGVSARVSKIHQSLAVGADSIPLYRGEVGGYEGVEAQASFLSEPGHQ